MRKWINLVEGLEPITPKGSVGSVGSLTPTPNVDNEVGNNTMDNDTKDELEKRMSNAAHAQKPDVQNVDPQDEHDARQKAKDEGMDPDFVGNKGYPNWHMFTKAASKQTQDFLSATKKLFNNP